MRWGLQLANRGSPPANFTASSPPAIADQINQIPSAKPGLYSASASAVITTLSMFHSVPFGNFAGVANTVAGYSMLGHLLTPSEQATSGDKH
jgi:hypothetical protein